MFDKVRNLFRSGERTTFDVYGQSTTTKTPSPFKGHVVQPLQNAAKSVPSTGKFVVKELGAGLKSLFTGPARTEEENTAVLRSMAEGGLNL